MSRLLCLALLLLPGCLPKKTKPPTAWLQIDTAVWSYNDPDLYLRLEIGQDRQYRWEFRNHRPGQLIIDHRELAIHKQDDPRPITLWGEHRDRQQQLPMTAVFPDSFLVLTYPVQYRSPLFPFEPELTSLHFTARWPDSTRSYSLPFATAEKATEEGPDR